MWAKRSMKCDGSRVEKRVESKQKKSTKTQKHDVEKNEGRYEVAGGCAKNSWRLQCDHRQSVTVTAIAIAGTPVLRRKDSRWKAVLK